MKAPIRILAVAGVVAVAALGTAALTTTSAAPAPKTTKTVTISCPNGWRGSGGGVYGGVPISVDCNFDKSSFTIDEVEGTQYSLRMGAESVFQGAIDCFFSGDDAHVNVSCGDVKVTVR